MDEKNQKVYDAALAAARRLGREGEPREALVPAVLDSPEVADALPEWGVGRLPATLLDDLAVAYHEGENERLIANME